MIAFALAALLAQASPVAGMPVSSRAAERIAGAQAKGPLAPEAQSQLNLLRQQIAAARARLAAEGPASSLAAQLRRRVELDQLPRRFDIDYRLPDRERLEDHRAAETIAIDDENTAWLKSVLPADGWFRRSRDGHDIVKNAWIILIHSQDDAWVDQVLERMEPLARRGEVDAGAFAMRYDRVQVLKGRPQRYGMGSTCVNGYKDYYPIEDRANVDARRKTLGLKPLAATAKDNNIGNWCGGSAAMKKP